MTLSQDGINYICLNFGDAINHCCVATGLSWYYTLSGTDYPETGGTAQIVSRLASGLVDSLTMTSPATGTFTQAQLNTANGSPVTLQDAQQIAAHDEPSEGQWCYTVAECIDYLNQVDCVAAGCYWWNGSCHSASPSCEELNNQIECSSYGCYWWSDNTCHSTPEPTPECTDYLNQIDCEAAGCYWWDGSCHSTPEPTPECTDYLNQVDCEAAGCYWYDGSCHSTPPSPPIPDWWWIPVVGVIAVVGIGIAVVIKKKR